MEKIWLTWSRVAHNPGVVRSSFEIVEAGTLLRVFVRKEILIRANEYPASSFTFEDFQHFLRLFLRKKLVLRGLLGHHVHSPATQKTQQQNLTIVASITLADKFSLNVKLNSRELAHHVCIYRFRRSNVLSFSKCIIFCV